MNLINQIKHLYDTQLYTDVRTLTSLLMTYSEHNPEFLTLPQKYQALVYHAEALYHNSEYKKAEATYRKALQTKKVMNKSKIKSTSLDIPSEVDVKYRLHECYTELKQYKEAIAQLEVISTKQRNSKINMALARLYQRTGMDRSAVTCYKEVLRECPVSLEAAQGLLSLQVKGSEVFSLMWNGISGIGDYEWLSSWVKAQSFAASKEYNNSIQTLKALDAKPLLRDNVDLLLNLGETLFMHGDYTQASNILQRAHTIDPLMVQKMDILAFLYNKEKKVRELENLSIQLMSVTENEPEPWVATGYYCMATKKGTRAIYFGQKAYGIDNRSLEALILKGSALLELKKTQEAIVHYRQVLRLAPHRYEAHKGLIDCYMASHRTREAITCAGQAYKELGSNARSLTLYASVLAKEPLSLEKAKSYLEKAMKLDPNYLEAVYIMSEIYLQQHQYDKGAELLRKTLRQQTTCRLHQMLGDFLSHTSEAQEALDQYSIALSLDPNNHKAREGLERVEKQGDLGMDSTLDIEAEDMEGSENEADLEGSDFESAWSDVDLVNVNDRL